MQLNGLVNSGDDRDSEMSIFPKIPWLVAYDHRLVTLGTNFLDDIVRNWCGFKWLSVINWNTTGRKLKTTAFTFYHWRH